MIGRDAHRTARRFDFVGKAIEPHGAVAHGLGLPPGDHLVELRQVLVSVCHR